MEFSKLFEKILVLIGLFFSFFTYGEFIGVSSLNNIDLSNLKCDLVVNDEGYYDENNKQFKFLWYDFENKSNFPYYFWGYKFKIANGKDLVKINYSHLYKYDLNGRLVGVYTGIFLPSYKYFCLFNFSIPQAKKVRILTTAEEISSVKCGKYIYKAGFTYPDWHLNNGVSDDTNGILPNNFTFFVPILSIISHGTNLNNSKFSLKFGILFDKDNNLKTKKDNFVKVVCYNLKIGRCGDGIVEKQFGEECDPNGPNGDKCQSNCKLTCPKTEEDIDGDCVPNNKDLAPTIPEDKDGIEDEDGIPDIGCLFGQCFPNRFAKVKCDTCPCPMVDYGGDLRWGDTIKATLWDKNGKIMYTQSEGKVLNK